MSVDSGLLAILVCPACRGGLDAIDGNQGLCCARCAVVYPVREDIPVMLTEEAVPLSDWNKGRREKGKTAPASNKTA